MYTPKDYLHVSLLSISEAAGLPNILGEATNFFISSTSLTTSGALTVTATSQSKGGSTTGSQYKWATITFKASDSNTIYADSVTTVTPTSIKVKFFIKY